LHFANRVKKSHTLDDTTDTTLTSKRRTLRHPSRPVPSAAKMSQNSALNHHEPPYASTQALLDALARAPDAFPSVAGSSPSPHANSALNHHEPPYASMEELPAALDLPPVAFPSLAGSSESSTGDVSAPLVPDQDLDLAFLSFSAGIEVSQNDSVVGNLQEDIDTNGDQRSAFSKEMLANVKAILESAGRRFTSAETSMLLCGLNDADMAGLLAALEIAGYTLPTGQDQAIADDDEVSHATPASSNAEIAPPELQDQALALTTPHLSDAAETSQQDTAFININHQAISRVELHAFLYGEDPNDTLGPNSDVWAMTPEEFLAGLQLPYPSRDDDDRDQHVGETVVTGDGVIPRNDVIIAEEFRLPEIDWDDGQDQGPSPFAFAVANGWFEMDCDKAA
jgi:hypothetical protein